mmetsp:Transcript_19551/g.48351  ORF Transcript_19551/g.48351 Transcript_19551/m.48351 type:complete len:269 (-) Transcript_19551:175-981(-)
MLRRALSQLATSAHGAAVARSTTAASGICGAHTLRSFTSSAAHATTVLCVRKDGEVVIMADGQVTQGSQVMKPNVIKVRRLQSGVVGGFAGATADAFTLFERLEMKLEEHPGQLTRAAVELAKAWRSDKYLRRLEATMVVADKDHTFQITGGGDVIEPHDGVLGIGSGGPFATAAARALIDLPGFDALTIARKAMNIAADTCVYTNHNFITEVVSSKEHSIETLPESPTMTPPDTTPAAAKGEAKDSEAEGKAAGGKDAGGKAAKTKK